jgi:periplasmic divalent cation tolerance protein
MTLFMKEKILLVFCTVANDNDAKSMSHLLLTKKLAACCTFIPGLTSLYHWQGKIEESQETLLLIKTTQKKYSRLEKEIKMLHSYEVPEIIAVNIETASAAYVDWLLENIGDTE